MTVFEFNINDSEIPKCPQCHVPLGTWTQTLHQKIQCSINRAPDPNLKTHPCPAAANMQALYLLGKRTVRRRKESGDPTIVEMHWTVSE